MNAPPGNAPARSHEAELGRLLRPMIRQVRRTLGRVQTPEDARALGHALRKAWPDERVERLVRRVGVKAIAWAERPWRSVAPRQDASGAELIDTWSRAAASLITSVRDDVAEGLRKDVVEALRTGQSHDELAAKWRRKGVPLASGGTLEGRTKVIAQHQLSTLHAEVQRTRATAVGVSEFVWRTQGDSRVRDDHRSLDGRTFSYATGAPGEGLPGQPVGCRCWAESVIPDTLGV